MGVVAAELVEEMEDVLSARAKGATGGGLAECTGGLNGRLTSPAVGFPGGSLGRDGGRGGGGGGVGFTDDGVLGLTGDEEPLFVPGVGPGDDTIVLYVGGGGGGGVLLLSCAESLGEATASTLSSLDGGASGLLGCSSGDGTVGGTGGGGVERVVGVSVGGVLIWGGGLVGETTGGDAVGGDVANVNDSLSCGVDGADGTRGMVGSSEGGGEVGKGGSESSFGGVETGGGGAGSSGRGGGVGAGGEERGGGGEVGKGGVRSFPDASGCSAGSSLKHTQESLVSSPAGGACSGPKRLSRSAMEGFLLELSASVVESAISVGPAVGGVVGTFLGGRGGGASVLCSPKAVSNGGPNKAVVSSETGD